MQIFVCEIRLLVHESEFSFVEFTAYGTTPTDINTRF